MAEKPLLTLVDGAILEFKDDFESSAGCETCDYGSRYVSEFTIVTTVGTWTMRFGQMYEYPVSQGSLMRVILPASSEIQRMTVEGFIEWLTARLKEECEGYGGQEPGFEIEKREVRR